MVLGIFRPRRLLEVVDEAEIVLTHEVEQSAARVSPEEDGVADLSPIHEPGADLLEDATGRALAALARLGIPVVAAVHPGVGDIDHVFPGEGAQVFPGRSGEESAPRRPPGVVPARVHPPEGDAGVMDGPGVESRHIISPIHFIISSVVFFHLPSSSRRPRN